MKNLNRTVVWALRRRGERGTILGSERNYQAEVAREAMLRSDPVEVVRVTIEPVNRAKVACPVCGREVGLTLGDTICFHANSYTRCDGTGRRAEGNS